MKYRVAILKNELETDHYVWLESCKKNECIAEADVIELLSSDWFLKVKQKEYDAFILKPSGIFSHLKQLYDERVIILSDTFNTLLYPSLNELLIYENKRFLRDWLTARNLPHPLTQVFYSRSEALDYLDSACKFPVVAKTNIGGSGNGVWIIDGYDEACKYINNAFSRGIYSRAGFKITKGSLLKKIRKMLKIKGFLRSRIKIYNGISTTPQKDFVIFQEFVPHSFEWRCVRIGDSYFAHKKIAKNSLASGTLLKDYGDIPLKLLNFIRDITEKNNLTSVAIDIFENDGAYLINEIQCIFGQSDPYQMLVSGVPGRYRWISDSWVFEEGMFNTNSSYDLRVSHLISLLDEKQINVKNNQ